MTEEEELEQLMQEALDERDGVEEEAEEEDVKDEEENTEEDESEEELSEEEETENSESDEDLGDENEDDSEQDDSNEAQEDSGDDNDSFTPIEVDIGGHKVTISSQDELMTYVKKGADAFNQAPETHKEEKAIIEQANISPERLKLYAEVENGSKEALAKLAELNKIDTLEIDEQTAEQYKQTQEYNIPTEVEDVANELAKDSVHFEDLVGVMNSVPQEFSNAVRGDAKMLKHFSDHVKSGLAQEIIPQAMHAKNLYGGDFISHYARLGQEAYDKKNKAPEQRESSSKERGLRTRASKSRDKQNTKVEAVTEDDIFNMSDEDFADYQKSLQ